MWAADRVTAALPAAETPKPFDFLVAGTMVREPLQDLVGALGISAVRTQRRPPPWHMLCLPVADSGLRGLGTAGIDCGNLQCPCRPHRRRLRCAVAQELVLDIQYGTAVLPPKLRKTLPHDDWCAPPPLLLWPLGAAACSVLSCFGVHCKSQMILPEDTEMRPRKRGKQDANVRYHGAS